MPMLFEIMLLQYFITKVQLKFANIFVYKYYDLQ